MKIIRTVLVASALVAGAASAQAQVISNIHGGPASAYASEAPQTATYSDQARSAYAQHPARVHRPQHPKQHVR